MKCLGKIVRTAVIEKKDWKRELDVFLMAYRATPHPSTDMSPAELMYPNRCFKTHLPPSPLNSNTDCAEAFNKRAMSKAKEY